MELDAGGALRSRRRLGAVYADRVKAPALKESLVGDTTANARTDHDVDEQRGQLLVGVLMIAPVLIVQFLLHYRLPVVVPVDGPPSVFSEGRALQHLRVLCDEIGPRPIGSAANSIATPAYLTEHVRKIALDAHPNIAIEYDLQETTGSFNVQYRGFLNLTNGYVRVKNFVVRLSRNDIPESKTHAMMLGTHTDSYPHTVGASDAGAPVAILLEVMRALAVAPGDLAHSVIFVFNGGEEFGLQASHGFICCHPWAKSIRGFINLDAGGVGGREGLIQTGPNNYWIAKAYAEAAPHPHADVVGQDLFGSGVVPSDTDFRVYAENGNIGGLDMLYYENSWLYHTKHDTIDAITPGSLQHTGDNVLSTIRHIMESQLFLNLNEDGDEIKQPAVYFTLKPFGYMICVTGRTAMQIEWIAIIWTLAYYARWAMSRKSVAIACAEVVSSVVGVTIIFSSAVLTAGMVAFILAYVASAPLSWLSYPLAAVLLFSSASLAGILAVLRVSPRSPNLHHGILGCWLILLLTASYWRLGSAYLPLLFVIGLYCSRKLVSVAKPFHNVVLSSFARFGPLLIPICTLSQTAHSTLTFFLPTMNRIGNLPADLVIAVLISVFTCLLTSCAWPLLLARGGLRSVWRAVVTVLALTAIVCQLLLPVYLPESSPKRILVQQSIDLDHGFSNRIYVISLDQIPVQRFWASIVNNNKDDPLLRRLKPVAHIDPTEFQALYPLAVTAIASASALDSPRSYRPAIQPSVKLSRDSHSRSRRVLELTVDPAGALYGTFNISSDSSIESVALDGLPIDLPATQTVERGSDQRSSYFVRTVAGDGRPFRLLLSIPLGARIRLRFEATTFGAPTEDLQFIEQHLGRHSAGTLMWLSIYGSWTF